MKSDSKESVLRLRALYVGEGRLTVERELVSHVVQVSHADRLSRTPRDGDTLANVGHRNCHGGGLQVRRNVRASGAACNVWHGAEWFTSSVLASFDGASRTVDVFEALRQQCLCLRADLLLSSFTNKREFEFRSSEAVLSCSAVCCVARASDGRQTSGNYVQFFRKR